MPTLPPSFHVTLSEAAQTAMIQAHKVGCSIYGIKIEVAQDCMMKSVRALMVMQALEAVSSTLASNPDEEALENEEFDSTFEVVLASELEAGEIRAAVEAVNEVCCVYIGFRPPQFDTGDAMEIATPHPNDLESMRDPATHPEVENGQALEPAPDERNTSPHPRSRPTYETEEQADKSIDISCDRRSANR